MFGTEEGDEIHIRGLVEKIDRRNLLTALSGVVGDETDLLSLKCLESLLLEHVNAVQSSQIRTGGGLCAG